MHVSCIDAHFDECPEPMCNVRSHNPTKTWLKGWSYQVHKQCNAVWFCSTVSAYALCSRPYRRVSASANSLPCLPSFSV